MLLEHSALQKKKLSYIRPKWFWSCGNAGAWSSAVLPHTGVRAKLEGGETATNTRLNFCIYSWPASPSRLYGLQR